LFLKEQFLRTVFSGNAGDHQETKMSEKKIWQPTASGIKSSLDCQETLATFQMTTKIFPVNEQVHVYDGEPGLCLASQLV